MSMWPFLFKLGLTAILGIGIGLALIQQESFRRDNEYNEPRRERSGNERSNRTEQQSDNQASGSSSRRGQSNLFLRSRSEEETQRELLENQLNSGTAECIICTENLSYSDKVWSCQHCWNIFHLHCISRWAQINGNVPGNRSCPVCRNSINIDRRYLKYKCMCGRITEPRVINGVTPHCCGMICMRNCGRLCHPGPCTASTNSHSI